jgi:hypothetical protein
VRILLDECLPRRLKAHLAPHDVRTVPEMGWAGRRNGELLVLAAEHFQVFLTIDRGLVYQQNIKQAGVAVVALAATSNRFESLLPLLPEVLDVIESLSPGAFVRISR